MTTKFDARQTICRDTLSQIYPNSSDVELDDILRSINFEITPVYRMDASATPDLTVSIQSSSISNTVNSRKKVAPHIGITLPDFSSGTIIFPAANGGTIVVTPGADETLTVPSGHYIKCLVYMKEDGSIGIDLGASSSSEGSANVPPPPSNENVISIGYITLFNNSGTIENITQDNVYQFPFFLSTSAAGGIVDSSTGNAIISLSPATSTWILQSPDLTLWSISVDNIGALVATSGATGSPVNFKVTKPDTSEASFTITNGGILQVNSPADGGAVLDNTFYLAAPSGEKFFITVNNLNNIVTKSNNNKFEINDGIGNTIFQVQEEVGGGSSIYCAIYDSTTLPSSLTVVTGCLPFAFYNNGVNKRMIFHDGISWKYVHDNSAV